MIRGGSRDKVTGERRTSNVEHRTSNAQHPTPKSEGSRALGLSSSRGLHPAFTLIELLAVIVIISLIAGITMANLAATDDDATLRAAVAAVRDLDQRARIFSQTGEHVTLAPSRTRDALLLKTSRDSETVAAAQMPRGITVHLDLPRTRRETVRFDSFGRSGDYRVVLRRGMDTLVWRVHGLTGVLAEEPQR